METNEDIIIHMLLISDFFKRESVNEKNAKLLLLEPIIVDIFSETSKLSPNSILEKLKKLKLSYDKSQSIITAFHSNGLICTINEKNMIFLNERNVNLDKLKKDIANAKRKKEEEWSNVKSTLISKINEHKCKHLTAGKLSKNILEFIYNLFEEIDIDKKDNKDRLLDIAIILESCGDNTENGNSCLLVFEDILLGVGIVQAIKRDAKGFEGVTLPSIYLDNIFMGNLFNWCNHIQYRSCRCIYDQLKTNEFKLKIHAETFNILSKTIENYIKMKRNKNSIPDVNSFFYYMQYIDEAKEFTFNVNGIEPQSITIKLKDALDKLGIEVENSSMGIEVKKDDLLYIRIEKDRKKRIEKRDGVVYNLSSDQTEYDYKIIKRYSSIDNITEDSISSIVEYFLTYQYAIYNNATYAKNTRTYTPIMRVRNFATFLLLENIMSNIPDNSKLLEANIHASYQGIMNDKLIEFFENVHNDINLKEKERKEILVYASMPTNVKSTFNIDILINDYDTIVNEFRKKDKKLQDQDNLIKDKETVIKDKDKEIEKTNLNLKEKEKEVESTQNKLRETTGISKAKDDEIDALKRQMKDTKIKHRKIIVNIIIIVIFILCVVFREKIKPHIEYWIPIMSTSVILISLVYNLIDKPKK